ncbi:hypothetical protein GCM10027570_42490 [Streptomonospora sediminis]
MRCGTPAGAGAGSADTGGGYTGADTENTGTAAVPETAPGSAARAHGATMAVAAAVSGTHRRETGVLG